MIKTVVVGAGKWAHECWLPLLLEQADRLTVRAVVDYRPDAALALATGLGLTADAAHSDLPAALDHTPGLDAGIVLTSPEQHAAVITALAERGLHVLTEKPLATTPDEATAIAHATDTHGVKIAVVQNYRYETRIQRFRHLLHTGDYGDLSHLVARFAADYRRPGSWDVGDAHHMPDPLLIEGAIHHLDMIRYLTGREITTVTAMTRNPPWSSFAGPAVAGLLLRLDNDALAIYEGTLLAAGEQRRWHREQYRAECADATLTLQPDTIEIQRNGSSTTIPVPTDDPRRGHRQITSDFAGWLTGGPTPDTHLRDNLHSISAVFAARQAAETGHAVPTSPTSQP
jgi:predicted dehydrogenase